jgi:hypothetical protein
MRPMVTATCGTHQGLHVTTPHGLCTSVVTSSDLEGCGVALDPAQVMLQYTQPVAIR